MELSKVKCLSHLESDQSQLLALTHPYVCTGREQREGNPKTNIKVTCQCKMGKVVRGQVHSR